MIKNLVSFGCSWTYGSELEDPIAQSYPAKIAAHYGWTLENRAVPKSELHHMLNNFDDWITHSSEEHIAESLVLIGLTHETEFCGRTEDNMFEHTVTQLDKVAKDLSISMLQFNVLARQHKIKLPTLIESSSALEMLVIRDKPRKHPLFAEFKHPNEQGHKIISEFLINKIDSVIINE